MLKQLIQRLLDSRTTPQQAKDCNDLDFSKEITVLNTTAISSANFTYIAPDAGYIYRWIQCSGKSGTAMGADIIVNGKRMSGLAINNEDFEFGETIRVNKGNSVKFGTWGVSTLAQYLVKFVPLGGGYNLFVRRALSCLRPSFNFSQRSFFKVNIPTLLINADQVPVCKARQSQETARRTLWLHSQAGLSLRLAQTVRQTTHGLGLKTPPEELHTSPMQFANTKRLLSQCKKEMFLLLTSALITRTKAPFCLSLLKQQNNFGTGSALC